MSQRECKCYCRKCEAYTMQEFVKGKEASTKRLIIAICTLGISELFCKDVYRCTCCGHKNYESRT